MPPVHHRRLFGFTCRSVVVNVICKTADQARQVAERMCSDVKCISMREYQLIPGKLPLPMYAGVWYRRTNGACYGTPWIMYAMKEGPVYASESSDSQSYDTEGREGHIMGQPVSIHYEFEESG